jgi:hypothetical protein
MKRFLILAPFFLIACNNELTEITQEADFKVLEDPGNNGFVIEVVNPEFTIVDNYLDL